MQSTLRNDTGLQTPLLPRAKANLVGSKLATDNSAPQTKAWSEPCRNATGPAPLNGFAESEHAVQEWLKNGYQWQNLTGNQRTAVIEKRVSEERFLLVDDLISIVAASGWCMSRGDFGKFYPLNEPRSSVQRDQ